MDQSVLAIAGIVVPVAVIWVAFRYQNKITWDVQSITTKVEPIEGGFSTTPSTYRAEKITANRLSIANRGYRSLTDVELHFEAPNEPFSTTIASTKTLSIDAVKVTWENDFLKVRSTNFPSGEELKIDIFATGFDGRIYGPPKSTGGKFKVRRKDIQDIFEMIRKDVVTLLLFIPIIIAIFLAATGK